MKRLLKLFFNKIGFNIIKIDKETFNPYTIPGYDYSAEGAKAMEICRDYSMVPGINLQTLYEQAIYCEKNGIEGDFVECGVWKGGAVGIMALANKQFGKEPRKLHLFDSFDDLCEPDPNIDGEKALDDIKKYAGKNVGDIRGKLAPVKGFYRTFGGHGTIESCNDLLVNKIGYNPDKIIYHKGWFQDTLPADINSIKKIAILRLDGDWYESIKVCLKYLYPKVQKGGLVVIDDYGYYEGCTKAVDEFLLKNNIKTFLSYSNVGCRYFVK